MIEKSECEDQKKIRIGMLTSYLKGTLLCDPLQSYHAQLIEKNNNMLDQVGPNDHNSEGISFNSSNVSSPIQSPNDGEPVCEEPNEELNETVDFDFEDLERRIELNSLQEVCIKLKY